MVVELILVSFAISDRVAEPLALMILRIRERFACFKICGLAVNIFM